MLVVTPCKDRYQHIPAGQPEEEFLGIIYEIHRDKWGHKNKVLVEWSENVPPNYNPRHGFSGINIHNLRHEFKIIRDGIEVVG